MNQSNLLFSVESEAKAKTKVRFEEIFRRHAGLADKNKSRKKKSHSQENIVVSLDASDFWLAAFLSGKRPGKCTSEMKCAEIQLILWTKCLNVFRFNMGFIYCLHTRSFISEACQNYLVSNFGKE